MHWVAQTRNEIKSRTFYVGLLSNCQSPCNRWDKGTGKCTIKVSETAERGTRGVRNNIVNIMNSLSLRNQTLLRIWSFVGLNYLHGIMACLRVFGAIEGKLWVLCVLR